LAAVLMNVIGRCRAGAQQECEPASALALRTDFATADEIALRDDPYQSAGRIDYRKAADVMLQHGFRGLEDAGVGRDRDDGAGHDLVRAHMTVSCSMYQNGKTSRAG